MGNNITIHPKTYFHFYPKEAKARFYYIPLPISPTSRCSYHSPDEIIYIPAKPSQDAYAPKHPDRPFYDAETPRKSRDAGTWETLVDAGQIANTQGIYESDAHKASQSHSIPTDLSEGFLTQIHASLFITFYLSIPIIPYQIRLSVQPGVYAHEVRVVSTLVALSLTLALLNIYLTYFPSIPGARNSLPGSEMIACDGPDSAQSSASAIHPEARIGTYSDSVTELIR